VSGLTARRLSAGPPRWIGGPSQDSSGSIPHSQLTILLPLMSCSTEFRISPVQASVTNQSQSTGFIKFDL
jgi:hypothetical protein